MFRHDLCGCKEDLVLFWKISCCACVSSADIYHKLFATFRYQYIFSVVATWTAFIAVILTLQFLHAYSRNIASKRCKLSPPIMFIGEECETVLDLLALRRTVIVIACASLFYMVFIVIVVFLTCRSRTRVRAVKNIEGSEAQDCCLSCVCSSCVLWQLFRELSWTGATYTPWRSDHDLWHV